MLCLCIFEGNFESILAPNRVVCVTNRKNTRVHLAIGAPVRPYHSECLRIMYVCVSYAHVCMYQACIKCVCVYVCASE